jgi:hypothetical protein
MLERSPAVDEFDACLADIDRRLGEIQDQLISATHEGHPARDLVISAGPFTGTGGLRAFERALSVMPGVRDVIVREYAGEDRAIVDVRLGDPTP